MSCTLFIYYSPPVKHPCKTDVPAPLTYKTKEVKQAELCLLGASSVMTPPSPLSRHRGMLNETLHMQAHILWNSHLQHHYALHHIFPLQLIPTVPVAIPYYPGTPRWHRQHPRNLPRFCQAQITTNYAEYLGLWRWRAAPVGCLKR